MPPKRRFYERLAIPTFNIVAKSAQYDPTDSPHFLKTGELIRFGFMMAEKLELVSTKIEEVSTEIIIQCALHMVLSHISRCAERVIHLP